MVETLADLPDDFRNELQVTINDREFEVIARNAILLLFALNIEHTSGTTSSKQTWKTAESRIHLWYSASVTSDVLIQLQDKVKPLIDNVCNQIGQKSTEAMLGKTWTLEHGNTLRLVLSKENWLALQTFFNPTSLTIEKADNIRTATTLAPERADYRDRWYFKDQSPFMRIAKHRFREDGLLLPFGHPRSGFSIPNQ